MSGHPSRHQSTGLAVCSSVHPDSPTNTTTTTATTTRRHPPPRRHSCFVAAQSLVWLAVLLLSCVWLGRLRLRLAVAQSRVWLAVLLLVAVASRRFRFLLPSPWSGWLCCSSRLPACSRVFVDRFTLLLWLCCFLATACSCVCGWVLLRS